MTATFRVVMRNQRSDGFTEEATDPHVPADQLDAYLSDARTRWQSVDATPNTEE